MEVRINILEVASELAEKELNKIEGLATRYGLQNPFPNGIYIEDEEETRYTEEAQTIFDELYDDYYDMLWQLKE